MGKRVEDVFEIGPGQTLYVRTFGWMLFQSQFASHNRHREGKPAGTAVKLFCHRVGMSAPADKKAVTLPYL